MAELPTQRDFEDFGAWSGRDVLGPDGDRLGAVELIFLDEASGVPEWVLVKLDDGAVFVPLAGATVEEQSIRVGQAADRVAGAPRVDVGDTLSVADEKRLYEHYGLDYSREESSTVLPEGASAEQEEKPRLRKYVGAPVAAPEADEAAGAKEAASAEDAAATDVAATADPGASAKTDASDMSPRNLSHATPSPLPPAEPHVIPPEGGFQAREELEQRGSKLRIAIPATIAGAIAGLIAVLAWRKRR